VLKLRPDVTEPVLTRIDPFFSPRPWGTRSLAPLFPEKSNLQEPIGEAWLTAQDARVANGPFAGKSLGESWRAMPEDWKGTRNAAYPEFPVLAKFLFPKDKLSIQVHPDDAFAKHYEQAAGGRGKTEMWHIVSAEPGAELLIGLKPGVSRTDFLEGVAHHTVEDLFVRYPVRAGETYFVEAGTQHAILPGMIVCEIQEYSDLTYRVYDYGRVDAQGKTRELHLEKAMEVTKFNGTRSGPITPLPLHSPDANKHLLAACEFFATERWDCDRTTPIESDPAEFQLLVILSGSGVLYDPELSYPFVPGNTWFLPAGLPFALLQPKEPTSLLRITVPDKADLNGQLLRMGFDQQAISRVLMV
jgi:mannose-6-phosphate isomerase